MSARPRIVVHDDIDDVGYLVQQEVAGVEPPLGERRREVCGRTCCLKQCHYRAPARLDVVRLQIQTEDRTCKRVKWSAVHPRRRNEPLHDRGNEGAGTDRWLDESHRAKVAIRGVPNQVEDGVYHPATGEDFSI
jgi:hypothetical protein